MELIWTFISGIGWYLAFIVIGLLLTYILIHIENFINRRKKENNLLKHISKYDIQKYYGDYKPSRKEILSNKQLMDMAKIRDYKDHMESVKNDSRFKY